MVTPAGNSSASSTEFNLMVKCPQTKPLEVVMTPSTLSSQRLELESTFQDASSSILNQLSSTKSEPEHTDNSSTPNNLSQEKKMLQTTSLEDTTPLERKLLTFALTESESLLTTVLVFKDSLCSTQLEEELDQDLDLFY